MSVVTGSTVSVRVTTPSTVGSGETAVLPAASTACTEPEKPFSGTEMFAAGIDQAPTPSAVVEPTG